MKKNLKKNRHFIKDEICVRRAKHATINIINYLEDLDHKNIGFVSGKEYINGDKEIFVDRRERTYKEEMQPI
ncbi:hypothetical protein [Clostridium sp. FP1]|uniref:hypothetical protein n=1 Tax=Clostridium sp. FP1 TaxID=2724076 RepID=UPI001CCF2768|nr:hypothetical protein [Clostridium sp. FP1]MBZ9633835.1 hypothetical protein [Clostridium sp. FP1]